MCPEAEGLISVVPVSAKPVGPTCAVLREILYSKLKKTNPKLCFTPLNSQKVYSVLRY